MDERLDASVVVLTYDRNTLLVRTLDSLLAQTNPTGLRWEVVVVDNHPEERARAVVQAYASTRLKVRYLADGRRNVAHLRNTGGKSAQGEIVAFIDDDEAAAPDWLGELVATLRRTGADAAIGPRLAELADAEAPGAAAARAIFERVYALSPDAEMRLLNRRGRPMYGIGMGNSAVVAARCLDGEAPFDPAFGVSGGEDTAFFSALHRAGRRVVWAAGARVTEWVQPHRTEVPYRLNRIRRESQLYARAYMGNTTQRARVALMLAAIGSVQAVAGTLLAAVTGEHGSTRRARWRTVQAKGLGKLTWRRPRPFVADSAVR